MYNFTTEANCIGIDVEMFFPQDTKHYIEPELIKRVCDNCVVKTECYDYAIEHAVIGWWGGTSEQQRKEIRRVKNITPIPVLISEKWVQ